jgi:organic radical activating enzyme
LGKHKHINLDNLETFFNKFSDRKVLLTLTGGECTTHPQFIDIITLAKRLGITVSVDSNSVRTVRFYNEVKELVDCWNFTLHPSQHTFDLDKIRAVTDHSFVVVFVSMDPDHWEKSVDWYYRLCKLDNIKVMPIKLMSDWAGATCDVVYTDEQKEFMAINGSKLTLTKERYSELEKTHQWLLECESYSTDTEGNVSVLDPYRMIKENTNVFTGWLCNAGNDSISIYDNESVDWANCGIKRYRNFLDIDPIELKNPIVCTLPACTCGTDIRSAKVFVQ